MFCLHYFRIWVNLKHTFEIYMSIYIHTIKKYGINRDMKLERVRYYLVKIKKLINFSETRV